MNEHYRGFFASYLLEKHAFQISTFVILLLKNIILEFDHERTYPSA